jgi:thiamine-monophosphate kinase
MKVSELGEFGLIDFLAKLISDGQAHQPPNPRLYIGIGDDAAAWRIPDEIQLATVDAMVEGVHFQRGLGTWKELGWKALAINVSDIAAMAGVPDYALVSLNLPDDTLVQDVRGLYLGMLELSNQLGLTLIGGNVARSPVMVISITVLGSGREDILLRRSTARIGDVVAVTGRPGYAAAGREMLTNGLSFGKDATRRFRNAFLKPMPRFIEAQSLVKNGITTAIDLSDGLVADLQHICRASRVGAKINVEKLPLGKDLQQHFPERAVELTLSGGESYELLFTGAPDAVTAAVNEINYPIAVIGEIVEEHPGSVSLVDTGGHLYNLEQSGWRHF